LNHSRLNTLPPLVCAAETIDLAGCHTNGNVPSFRRFLSDDSGQDLIEYALVAALVGLGAITALKGLSTHIGTSFSTISSTLTSSV
jgi:pilus assembly protein Flp/PilA